MIRSLNSWVVDSLPSSKQNEQRTLINQHKSVGLCWQHSTGENMSPGLSVKSAASLSAGQMDVINHTQLNNTWHNISAPNYHWVFAEYFRLRASSLRPLSVFMFKMYQISDWYHICWKTYVDHPRSVALLQVVKHCRLMEMCHHHHVLYLIKLGGVHGKHLVLPDG